MIAPYKINTLLQQMPFANWGIIAVTSITSIAALYGGDAPWAQSLVLENGSLMELLGYMFLHADLIHLVGNMLMLWVFGNAICGNSGNLIYTLAYLAFGIAGGFAHLTWSDGSAVGASGAINGIVGMAVAMYPKNYVSIFYFFWFFSIKTGTYEIPLWILAFFWLAWDIINAMIGLSDIAIWAHIGGFAAGLFTGLLFLRLRIVQLTEWDNESLDQIFLGK